MGLAWQQGPLATGSVGHFLTEQPLPPRLLFAEPLRRRMRVRFADHGSSTLTMSSSYASPAAIQWHISPARTFNGGP